MSPSDSHPDAGPSAHKLFTLRRLALAGIPILLLLFAVLAFLQAPGTDASPDASDPAEGTVESATDSGSPADPSDPESRHRAPDHKHATASANRLPDDTDAGRHTGLQPTTTARAPRTAGGEGQDPEPVSSIGGTVFDDQGVPLKGIRVLAEPVSPASQVNRSDIRTTDRLGMFTFPDLPEGEYKLSAEGTRDLHPAAAQVRAGMDGVEIQMQRRISIRVHGTVTEPGGQPLAGARIQVLGGDTDARADEGGSWSLDVQPTRADQEPVLSFQHAGFRQQRRRLDPGGSDGEGAIRIDVELEPVGETATVAGRVQGPRGEPVAGASVELHSANPRAFRRTTSNAAGEFRLRGIEVGDSYRMAVHPDDPGIAPRRTDSFAVQAPETVHDVKLDASDRASLSATVVDPAGVALPGFFLWMTQSGMREPMPLRTDGSGAFQVESVAAGPVTLETRSRPRLEVRGIRLLAAQARQLVIPIDWGNRWLFGRVVDGADNPVPGARVVLQWSRDYPEFQSSSRRHTLTDAGGYFSFSNLGATDYRVVVRADRFRTARIHHALAPEDPELLIRLREQG